MKVIERDSSGFISARSFDDTTDRRSKDPFSRSAPGDRWSELRSGGGGRSAGVGGNSNNTEHTGDEPVAPPTTPGSAAAPPAAGEEREEDWRSVRKDRQRKILSTLIP